MQNEMERPKGNGGKQVGLVSRGVWLEKKIMDQSRSAGEQLHRGEGGGRESLLIQNRCHQL